MQDISGHGTGIVVLALKSFPFGFTLSNFADDEDPIKAKDIEPFGYEVLYDGSIFPHAKASPVEVSVAVIPNSEDDINLKILLASKPDSLSFLPFEDVTSMVITYPDGGRVVLSNGTIIRGPALDSIQATGRRKGNVYTFAFGSITGAQSAKQLISGVAQSLIGIL